MVTNADVIGVGSDAVTLLDWNGDDGDVLPNGNKADVVGNGSDAATLLGWQRRRRDALPNGVKCRR